MSGAGNDFLLGGFGADSLFGGEGDDLILFDADDLTAGVSGGGGFDTAFVGSDTAVTIDLGTSQIETIIGNSGNDTFTATTDVDVNMHGGAGNDTLTGGSGDDSLSGDEGQDSLSGGDGDDTLSIDSDDVLIDGGMGFDSVVANGSVGVTLDMTASSIEFVMGTDAADTFSAIGTSEFVSLYGRGGDDTLTAGSGDDRLTGGEGNDIIRGGGGLDVAVFLGNAADYQITGDHISATVTDLVTSDGDDGTDTLESVERLIFSDTTVHLDGTNNAPISNGEVWRLRSVDGGNQLSSGSLLENDWDYDRDYLQVAGIANVQNGTVSIDAAGNTVVATADGFVGDAGFDYVVSDGHGASSTATSHIEVFQALPDDDLFDLQWGLNWLNIFSAWDDYTGQGVKIAIHDDGVDQLHPDIAPNYDATIDEDPGVGAHGTFVTGVVGAARDGAGIVGAAYDATLAVYIQPNLFDFSFAGLENFDVVNNSWTQSLDTLYDGSSGTLVSNQLKTLADTGRGGLGTISVFSAGNDRQEGENASYSDGPNSRYAVTVAAIELDGTVADYSNPGASILVSAPGSQIVGTDIVGAGGFSDGSYVLGSDHFSGTGTSASAPLISGVIALMLEANPGLGWRDVQEILAYSAWSSDPSHNGWTTNGAINWNGGGLKVNHDYGFGLVDVHIALRLAETWQKTSTSTNEVSATASSIVAAAIPDEGLVSDTITVTDDIEIDHVEVTVNIDHTARGDLVIELTSPDGTTSVLMDRPGKAPNDPTDPGSTGDNVTWRFYTTHHWSEGSQGDWTLTVRDLATGEIGTLSDWSITFHGDTPSDDDTYIYTDDFGDFTTGVDAARRVLIDSAGHDVLNASGVTTNATIDLRPGETSDLAGNTLTIAGGTVIEDVFAGDGHDTVVGNDVANALSGGRGNDVLEGGLGADQLDGGRGSDTASYANSDAAVQVDLAAGTTAGGHAAGDVLTGIENLNGSQFDDTLTGDLQDNALRGGDGNDTLDGGGGADMLAGQAGDDILSGGGGDDVLVGGAGNDSLDGGTGNDTAFYIGAFADYTVDDSGPNIVVSGLEGTDTLSNIEFLQFNDRTVYVAGPNTAPVAANHSATLTQLVSHTLTEAALLQGATDADGDPLSLQTVFRSDNGVVTLTSDNDVRFLVDADFVGTATFNYAIADGKAGESTGTVSLTVDPTYSFTGTAADDIFLGLGSADTAHGGDGADRLDGGFGVDTLHGDAGADTLIGGHGDDVLHGGDDADTLSGGHGNDIVHGDAGDDTFLGDAGSDSLDGGVGTDTVDYSASADPVTVDLQLGTGAGGDADGDTLSNIETVIGSQGDDTLRGDMLANTLKGGDGADVLEGQGGADNLQGETGNDTLVGGAGDDTLVGGTGDDILRGGAGADQMDGGDGIDIVSYLDSAGAIEINLATATLVGSDTAGDVLVSIEGVEGSAFSDDITGTDTADQLHGAGGNDTLSGARGDDLLVGGLGNDTLQGDRGSDTYTYNVGDGDDVIFDSGLLATAETDRLILGSGLNAADVILTRETSQTDDVTLTFAGQIGSILLDEQFHDLDGSDGVEEIAFGDGTIWTARDLENAYLSQVSTTGNDVILAFDGDETLQGGLGNDTLKGGWGSDTYIYNVGDGDDVVIDSGGLATSNTDRLVLGTGLNAADVILTRGTSQTDDVTLTFTGQIGSILLDEQFHDLDGSDGVEEIAFGDGTIWTARQLESAYLAQVSTNGDDVILAFEGDETLEGGLGNDTLTGGKGADTYVYTAGDGDDVILEGGLGSSGDQLVLHGIAVADVTVIRSGVDTDDAILSFAGGGSVKLDEQFRSNGWDTVEQVVFDDGTAWDAATILQNAWFIGTPGDDTITGTSGNDNISGGAGADTLIGETGNDTLEGGVGADTYLFDAGDGTDVITDAGTTGETDVLQLGAGIDPAAVQIERGTSSFWDMRLVLGGSDEITVTAHWNDVNSVLEEIRFHDGTVWTEADTRLQYLAQHTSDLGETVNGFLVDDVIDAKGGDDSIYAYDGDDTLIGGAGDDFLVGGAGNDTYVFADGDGADWISDFTAGAGSNDVLDLTAVAGLYSLSDVLAVASEFNGVTYLDLAGTDEIALQGVSVASLHADDFLFSPGNPVTGTAGDDTLIGTDQVDIIEGKAGNDTLQGGLGGDIYVFNVGDGTDVITDVGTTGETDVLQLGAGITPASVQIERGTVSFWDMRLVLGGSDEITVTAHWNDANSVLEEIRFDDGTVWTEADTRLQYLAQHTSDLGETVNGFLVDDVIDAKGGDDSIYAYDGDDTLIGGAGDDFLVGGSGNDTFVFADGDGFDWISDFTAGAGSNDVVDLRGVASVNSFADVQAVASEFNGVTYLDLAGTDEIALAGVSLASLHEDDFRFV